MSRVEQFLLGAGRNREAVHVALVNNMPDAAMRATELQFARLLKEAAGPLDIRLQAVFLGHHRAQRRCPRAHGGIL